jgi:hypothetical protein
MIEAWFELTSGAIVPALVPDEQVREIARMADLPISDLFCIDVPGGATNRARIRVLIAQSALANLYANNGWLGTASCVFKWRENSAATAFAMNVLLLPPRPLFMVGGGSGIAVVEATDIRFHWARTSTDASNTAAMTPRQYSSDGRYVDSATYPTSLLELVQDIKNDLSTGGGAALLETFPTTGYAPNAALLDRVANYKWPQQASLALMLDTVLSLSGYALIWNPVAAAGAEKYLLVPIENNGTLLATWMTNNKRAVGSGLEPPSIVTATAEPLYDLWEGSDAMQYNRSPGAVDIVYPLRACEGQTHYPNNRAALPANGVRSPEFAETTYNVAVTTPRSRRSTFVGMVHESRAVAKNVATPPNWSPAAANTQIAANLVNRAQASLGRVVWGGWVALPNGVFRLSMYRFTLGERDGQVVPITLSECAEEDWRLGPDGLLPNDPREIVIGTGMVQARRLSSGTMTLNVMEPMCRIFPAEILSSEPCGASGNSLWQYRYTFREIEPDPTVVCPAGVTIGAFARSTTASTLKARNLCETPNVYQGPGNLNNVIGPGVRQSDYDPTKIIVEPVAIMAGTIVMMCEQFPTNSYTTQNPPAEREYWFSMPQAIKTICLE